MSANDDKIKHLEMIQGVIARHAKNMFALRGWAVVLVAAILTLSSKEGGSLRYLVALIPTFTFWGLDAYYLRQERLCRTLFDTVRALPAEELARNPFSMDTLPFSFPLLPETMADEERQVPRWWSTCWSKTVGWVYGSLTLAIVAVTLLAVLRFGSLGGSE